MAYTHRAPIKKHQPQEHLLYIMNDTNNKLGSKQAHHATHDHVSIDLEISDALWDKLLGKDFTF